MRSILASALLLSIVSTAHAQRTPPLIRAGQTVEGRLAAGDARDPDNGRPIDAYRYRGRAGERIAIDVASSDFHTLFTARRMVKGRPRELDRTSILVTGRNYHAEVVLPADGEYLIHIGSWQTVREGAYRFTLQSLSAAAAPADSGRYDGLYGLERSAHTGCVLSAQDYGASRIRFQVSCILHQPGRVDAWAAGMIPISRGHAVYRTTEHGGLCELRFLFEDGLARVEQASTAAVCGFTPGTDVSGTYRWVRAEPLFGQRPSQ